jgi:hypothetical protein
MEIKHTQRGFEYIELEDGSTIAQSSAIGDYPNALELPGSSFLWIDEEHCDREEVLHRLGFNEFIDDLKPHIITWLITGSLTIRE